MGDVTCLCYNIKRVSVTQFTKVTLQFDYVNGASVTFERRKSPVVLVELKMRISKQLDASSSEVGYNQCGDIL